MCPDNEWDSGEVRIPSAWLVVLADTFTLKKPLQSCPQQRSEPGLWCRVFSTGKGAGTAGILWDTCRSNFPVFVLWKTATNLGE